MSRIAEMFAQVVIFIINDEDFMITDGIPKCVA